MKAFKGCVNEGCTSYKKVHYKDEYNFCPICGTVLEYVCAQCWKMLEDNSERYCLSCKTLREQKAEERNDKIKAAGAAIASTATIAWASKGKIIKVGKKAIQVIKK